MPRKFGVFNPLRGWKKGDVPNDPTVSIILAEGYFSNSAGEICISTTLTSDSEIDYAVDQLLENLEAVRKEAKQVLKVQRNKMHS